LSIASQLTTKERAVGKYVYIYRGGGVPADEEAQQRAMAAWGAWFGALGEAIVDPGNPFGESGSVGSGTPSGLTGYSIVTADTLDDAVAKVNGCPILEDGTGSIEVYETIEM
jgi:hypothetical protein